MDPLSTPGGFLGGFLLGGIFLPITLSFLADGVVLYFRGRGPTRLLVSGAVSLAIIGLYSVAWQNAVYAGAVDQMSGAIGLILWFSIPAAILGFAVRMLALFLNPATKAIDQQAIARRAVRAAAREQARESVLGEELTSNA
jgi:hypothetical protein